MRDYKEEANARVQYIQNILSAAHADGIIYGNSGGKDSALVGILCKMACENTVGLIMPGGSKQNYDSDKRDAEIVARQYGIDSRYIDLADLRASFVSVIGKITHISQAGLTNIMPRLRMTALYTVAASENRLVAGTGNRSEIYMGYFTKWGDGAFDFNPIADLTVTETYEFLRYFNAPDSVLVKPPSGGLFDGQTDEAEMGISYESIDAYLLTGKSSAEDKAIIDRLHSISEHKRAMPSVYERE